MIKKNTLIKDISIDLFILDSHKKKNERSTVTQIYIYYDLF